MQRDDYKADQLFNAAREARRSGERFIRLKAGNSKYFNVDPNVVDVLAQAFYGLTRQAIRTRFHGPTNTTGSRYSATYAGGRVYWGAVDRLSPEENHEAAAQFLADKLGWGTVVIGACFDGDYYWITGGRTG